MGNNFARLETINGLQVLAEIMNGEDGPHIRLRRDNEVSCEASLGPWPDTEEGWDKAEAALERADLTKAAEMLDDMIAKLVADAPTHLTEKTDG